MKNNYKKVLLISLIIIFIIIISIIVIKKITTNNNVKETIIVNFNMDNDPMREYFKNVDIWKSDESNLETNMLDIFNKYNCSKCESDNSCNYPKEGTYCDKPKGYDTGTNDILNVYLYNKERKEKGNLVTYTTSTNGIIYNMIPGLTYYWESSTNKDINGVVSVSGTRRIIESSLRNMRDLGGMEVSFLRNGETKNGTIKYGKLFRGTQLSNGEEDVESLIKLGVTREIDLRATSEGKGQSRLPLYDIDDNGFEDVVITNFIVNPTTTPSFDTVHLDNYRNLKKYMKKVMKYVVDGDILYLHCTIGSDRSGTIAYFLEGLLGVPLEERLQDYELTYFYGLTNRHRFHDYLSGSSINPRFYSMYMSYTDYQSIYDFYTYEKEEDDDLLLEQFRDAMIDYN